VTVISIFQLFGGSVESDKKWPKSDRPVANFGHNNVTALCVCFVRRGVEEGKCASPARVVEERTALIG